MRTIIKKSYFLVHKNNLLFPSFRDFKDLPANCFCGSLLGTQINWPPHASTCALSDKMNNDKGWRMVHARLCETARQAVFFASPRHFNFLDCETETFKVF